MRRRRASAPSGATLVVSPHLDDAVLSCGGLVQRRRQAGASVTVLTAFAGRPEPRRIGPLAAAIHDACGLGDDAVDRRRDEDQRALAALGAEPVHLDFLELMYRAGSPRLFAGRTEAVRGHGVPVLLGLVRALAAQLRSTGATEVIGPAAAGRHVDHVIVHEAVRWAVAIHRSPVQLAWYDDVPYAYDSPARPGARWRPQVIVLTEAEWAAKVAAAAHYPSQLTAVFACDDWAGEWERRCTEHFSGTCAERLWVRS